MAHRSASTLSRFHWTSRAGIALMLSIGIVVLSPSPARACSCGTDPPPGEAMEASEAVFAGIVMDTHTVGDLHGELTARVRVDRVWKGAVHETVEVVTAANDGLCGLDFTTGDEWLLYASQRDNGQFSSHACTRSVPTAYTDKDGIRLHWDGEDELSALGRDRSPTPGEQVPASPAPPVKRVADGPLAVMALVLSLLLRLW